ncbi:hypothetical protein BDR03DRAFT_936176 [Suillus americanus]|nr:hypothetical protein BDR03DRAFT_936176 [Suillus americanus]
MQVLASFEGFDGKPPFRSDAHIYNTINAISLGDVPWQSLSLKHAEFENALPDDALWKCSEYEVWFWDPRELLQNQLANHDFKNDIDYSAQQVFREQGQRVWLDLMTGNWAWDQSASNILAEDPNCCDAMFVPIILGSDKTTVSVAIGQNDFYPLYTSAGNLRNNVCCAHKESVSLVGFLPIPKTERDHENSLEFRNFRRHIFHASPAIQKPEVVKCADGHFWRAVYGIGPYIADYPEQCLLACIIQRWCTCSILPFTAYFPRADIHDLLAPDISHQIIKGTFKDHIVDWVGQYLVIIHREAGAEQIWADIDHRIAAVPLFPGLHCFPQGDNSKALMKVFFPAITGHVPNKMLRALHHFLDFFYLICCSSLDEADQDTMDRALRAFHKERRIFKDAGVTPDGISLPRQHSLCHYRYLVQQFGASNGLCSSLTESKHHKAVKEPWRCSSGYLPLGQMLISNQWLDKLASFRAEKTAAGLRNQPLLPLGVVPIDPDANSEDFFLYCDDLDLEDAIEDDGGGHFHSAVALFHTASDICGVNVMVRHTFRSSPNWCGGRPHHDCVFIEHDPTLPGFQGLHVAQVILLFLFTFRGVQYPCALICWFLTISDQPCAKTGMWMVEPELDTDIHLIPVYGPQFLHCDITHSDSLMVFEAFYINKYSDYHVFEIVF